MVIPMSFQEISDASVYRSRSPRESPAQTGGLKPRGWWGSLSTALPEMSSTITWHLTGLTKCWLD